MKHPRILLIGGGNMGSAFLKALIKSSLIPRSRIFVVERSPVKARKLKKQFHVRTFKKIDDVDWKSIGIIILAVKPQDARTVLSSIRKHCKPQLLLVSIMAGMRISSLRRASGVRRIVRIMPNLPIAVGAGFSAWFAPTIVTKSQRAFVRKLLRSVGKEYEVGNEKILDLVTAVTGSGPAYVFSFVSDLVHAAQRLGFPRQIAESMVIETLKGSLHFLDGSSEDAEKLRDQVASKGGTTEAALKILKQARVRDAWTKAVKAAARRSREFSNHLDDPCGKL